MAQTNNEHSDNIDTLQFPTSSYIILGMLTFREMSGYELKAVLDKSIRHFYWSPAQSQIYSELRRLEAHGLVTMHKVIQASRPDKRVYSITPTGMDVVQQWFEYGKVEPDVYKSAFQLRLFLGHLLSPERLISLIGEQRRWLAMSILSLEEHAESLEHRIQGPEPEEELLFPFLIVDCKLESFRTELAWTDKALERLRQWYQDREG